MTDQALRELERAFEESGSEEAELAWLRERARAGEKLDWESYSRLHELDVGAAAGYLRWRVETGDLTQDKLELAAYCDHGPALVGRGGASASGDLSAWFQGLDLWGKEPMVHGALAAALSVVHLWKPDLIGDDGPPKDQILQDAQAWLACPCAEHAELAHAAGWAAEIYSQLAHEHGEEATELVAQAVARVAWMPDAPPNECLAIGARAISMALRLSSPESLESSIRSALVLHALDHDRGS